MPCPAQARPAARSARGSATRLQHVCGAAMVGGGTRGPCMMVPTLSLRSSTASCMLAWRSCSTKEGDRKGSWGWGDGGRGRSRATHNTSRWPARGGAHYRAVRGHRGHRGPPTARGRMEAAPGWMPAARTKNVAPERCALQGREAPTHQVVFRRGVNGALEDAHLCIHMVLAAQHLALPLAVPPQRGAHGAWRKDRRLPPSTYIHTHTHTYTKGRLAQGSGRWGWERQERAGRLHACHRARTLSPAAGRWRWRQPF